jgi:hypothetical protein
VAEKIKSWGKREKGERAKREKTMRESDIINFFALSPFHFFALQPDGC